VASGKFPGYNKRYQLLQGINMAKIFEEWTVLAHTPIEKLTENVWTVVGEVPRMSLKRRMVMIRTGDGQIIVHSPIALTDVEMAEVEQWGDISVIMVPNGWHRLDSQIYKTRYPDAKLVCPRGSRIKVEEVVSVDMTYDALPEMTGIKLPHIDGINEVEGVVEVQTEKGTVLVFNDLIFNIPHKLSIGGLFMRLFGSSGGPKVTRIMKFFAMKNKKKLGEFLENLAKKHEKILYIIPGHGNIVDQDCHQVLKNIAAAL